MLHGVLTIDKPAGITSHDVVNQVRKIVRVGLPAEARRAKAGHTGTLDPFATGVLLVALGSATRLIEYTHTLPKTYDAEIVLGATSTTDDVTGEITAGDSAVVHHQQLEETLKKFTGTIQQLPPVYAAIKIKGKKLYEYARRGLPAEALAKAGERVRTITIHQIELLAYNYPKLKLRVTCSTGTYIRALGRDVGVALGTGAYVAALRRIAIGSFDINQAVQLNKLSTASLSACLLPRDSLISHLPSLTLDAPNVAQLKQGKAISGETLHVVPDQPIALFDQGKQLIGIGLYDLSTHLLYPRKILSP